MSINVAFCRFLARFLYFYSFSVLSLIFLLALWFSRFCCQPDVSHRLHSEWHRRRNQYNSSHICINAHKFNKKRFYTRWRWRQAPRLCQTLRQPASPRLCQTLRQPASLLSGGPVPRPAAVAGGGGGEHRPHRPGYCRARPIKGRGYCAGSRELVPVVTC